MSNCLRNLFANCFFALFAGDKATALTRVQELEKELAAERLGVQQKLKEAEDRETLQIHRLRALSHVMGGNILIHVLCLTNCVVILTCGSPTKAVGAAPAADEGSLEEAASAFDRICARTRDALRRSTSALSSIYQTVLPKNKPPATVEALADVFAPGTSTMANYARAQMVGGSETTFILLMGHGIAGDFEKAVAGFPKNSEGKSAVTNSMKKEAGTLSRKMVTMLEQRIATMSERAARTSRARSESAS